VREKRSKNGVVLFDTRCTNQHGEEVLTGIATVIAPTKKLSLPNVPLPEAILRTHDHFDRFLREARLLPPILTAVVHPCSPEAIGAAIEARDEGLITPVLVGPEHKVRAAAELAGVSLAGLRIEATEHSHAAAVRGVELASTGNVEALMKGSLHTDELLGAVVAAGSGLRTDRRISQVYVLDVAAYSKPIVITDAAVNIAPTLEQKRDICQNAIDFLQLLGVERPLVAILAAVEIINPSMPATLDAAALTVMAMRGQITGAVVDGPLAFDNAISFDSARIKAIVSPVAGQADILVVPNLEAGNMLAKQLIYLAGADAAGLVLGARVPIILTSRSDALKVRLASAALAKLAAKRGTAKIAKLKLAQS
jgi:phosphate acetyltransferase